MNAFKTGIVAILLGIMWYATPVFAYVSPGQPTGYVNDFANILSEARKYRLGLIMAHQYIAQLDEVVADAVFGNVGTIVSFRVGAADAEILAKEFAPTFLEEDIVNLSKFNILLKLMIDGVASQPFSSGTLPPIGSPTGSAEKVIRISRERYAKRRHVIEEKIMRWSGLEPGEDDPLEEVAPEARPLRQAREKRKEEKQKEKKKEIKSKGDGKTEKIPKAPQSSVVLADEKKKTDTVADAEDNTPTISLTDLAPKKEASVTTEELFPALDVDILPAATEVAEIDTVPKEFGKEKIAQRPEKNVKAEAEQPKKKKRKRRRRRKKKKEDDAGVGTKESPPKKEPSKKEHAQGGRTLKQNSVITFD